MKAMHSRPVRQPLEKHGHGYMYLGNINDVLTDEGNAFEAHARPLEKHAHGYMYLGNINDVLTDEGNAFQARAAATGKARSRLYISRKHRRCSDR